MTHTVLNRVKWTYVNWLGYSCIHNQFALISLIFALWTLILSWPRNPWIAWTRTWWNRLSHCWRRVNVLIRRWKTAKRRSTGCETVGKAMQSSAGDCRLDKGSVTSSLTTIDTQQQQQQQQQSGLARCPSNLHQLLSALSRRAVFTIFFLSSLITLLARARATRVPRWIIQIGSLQ